MHTERKDPLIYSIHPDIEEAGFTSRKGIPYWILRNPDNHTYIRMNEDEYSLWNELKTGSSEKTLTSHYLNMHPDYSEKQVHNLIETLLERGFIHRKEQKIHGHIRVKEMDSWLSHYWELLIPLPGMGRIFDILDDKFGWILRSSLFPPIFVLFCLAGFSYFIITEPLPSYPILLGDDSQLVTVLSVYLILITAAVLHVFGHALACKVYGRSLGDAGFLLYYGMPGLYIDTSDIWMADRRSRVIVSLAGPAVNLFIGAFCALVVMVVPDSEPSTLLWRVAFLSFVVALININPLLEFDGYYALADLLEIHDLRTRSFTFLRSLSKGERYRGKEGWFLLIYGVASAVFTLAIVIVGIYFWKEHMVDLLHELSKDTWEMDHILATFAIVIVFVPFFAGMIISGTHSLAKKYREISRIRNESSYGEIRRIKSSSGDKNYDTRREDNILTRRLSK